MAGNCEVTPGHILALSRHRCPVTTHLCLEWGSFILHSCFSVSSFMRLIWHAGTCPVLGRHSAVKLVPDFHTAATAAAKALSGFIYQGDDRVGRTLKEFCPSWRHQQGNRAIWVEQLCVCPGVSEIKALRLKWAVHCFFSPSQSATSLRPCDLPLRLTLYPRPSCPSVFSPATSCLIVLQPRSSLFLFKTRPTLWPHTASLASHRPDGLNPARI